MSKLKEAQTILKELGLPDAQQNEVSALTLLALCGIKETDDWKDAQRSSLKITKGIMAFMAKRYKRRYAPNTRETVRRQVLHQFVQARLADYNPDNPQLPVNSPNAHYAISKVAIAVVRFAFIIVSMCFLEIGHSQWLRQDIPSDVTMLLTIDFANPNVGAAAGYAAFTNFYGRAVYTSDGGTTWTLAQVPDSARSLVTLTFINADTGYIAGAYNVQHSTMLSQHKPMEDYRSHKRPMAIGAERYLARIGMNGVDNYRGLFLATTNGGQTWSTKGSIPDSIYYMIGASFLNSMLGYVTADAHPQSGIARILKTTDGGETWERLTIPDSVVSLRSISFQDSLAAIAAGYQFRNNRVSGVILRTSDAGANWQLTDFPPVDNFTDIFFVNSSTGFAVGVYSTSGFGVPPPGAIYKTTDAGVSWFPLAYQPDTVLIEGVRFAKGTGTGIIYGDKYTTDSLGFGKQLLFFARTTDYGTSWTESIITVDSNKILHGGKLITPLVGYLCGGDVFTKGIMLHTTNGGVTGVDGNDVQIVQNYQLLQNYPNPFNPSTTISFTLPRSSFVTLKVYSVLGQELYTIFSGILSPAVYNFLWRAPALASGIYYYRLQAGEFVETKKMVVLR